MFERVSFETGQKLNWLQLTGELKLRWNGVWRENLTSEDERVDTGGLTIIRE